MAIDQQNPESSAELKSNYSSLFFSNSPVMFCVGSKDGHFIEMNTAFAVNHGYSVDELIGKHSMEVFAPEVREKFLEQLEIINQEGHLNFESIHIRKDGSKFPVEVDATSVRDEHGNVQCRIVTVVDISAYKNAEEQLRKLSSAVEHSPVSIVITDTNGDIEYANQKAFETTGYSLDELKGQNPRVLKSGELKASDYQLLWDTITAGKTWSGIFHNKKKDGTLYWEKASISPVFNSLGNITHYVAAKEDITEKKKAEDNLIASEAKLKEANATKDKLFSIIAHDLRGPIGNFIPVLELLTTDASLTEEERTDLLNGLVLGSKSAFILLENLLHWASSQSNRIKLVPAHYFINEILNRNIHLLSPAAFHKSINISLNAQEELSVYIDKESVDLVVRNLLSNAIKFTREGGEIVISTRNAGDFVEVEMADNGIGIPKEIAENLFILNSFYTTQGTNREKGSGLGLVMCRDFVEKNGGKIHVDSIPGQGSKFIFTLPVK